MRIRKYITAVCIWIGCLSFAHAQHELQIQADNVNLRAGPSLTSEVVTQVQYGDRLKGVDQEGEWVSVVPPADVFFWAHNDFIRDGRVTASKLNVRSGAGINYKVVGRLYRNDEVKVLDTFGEWVKIPPPADSMVWVNQSLVKKVEPEPEAVAPSPPPPRPALQYGVKPDLATASSQPPVVDRSPATDVAESSRVTPVKQTAVTQPERTQHTQDLDLVPLRGQGRLSVQEGTLKEVGFYFGRPTRFRLAEIDGNRVETICFIRGNRKQLESFVGQRLKIKGREYWVQGQKYPIIIPEQISPLR